MILNSEILRIMLVAFTCFRCKMLFDEKVKKLEIIALDER